MKKLLALLVGLLVVVGSSAQTFPVNNLTVSGTSQFTGQGNFTLSPTAPTPTTGDSSTKLATTAFVQASVVTGVPTASSNAALEAISTVGNNEVWRLGFTLAGDSPPLLYVASTSACTLNAGAGDNGSQVKSANNLCWLASFSSREYDVHEWGVTGNGTTDDTAAIQAAINYAQTSGGSTLYFSAGIYKYTSLSVTASLHIKGVSRNATFFLQNSTTNVGIVVNTVSGFYIEGVFFSNVATPTAGAAISLSAPSGNNAESVIRDCAFAVNWIGVETISAAQYVIDSNYFTQDVSAGLLVQNQANVDSGDSVVTNNVFSNIGSTAVGILQYSSGGLKIIGNKLIGGGYGYEMQLAASASTSDLVFSGNSVENQVVAGLQMSNPGGAGTLFSNTVISGNQFAGQSAPIALSDTHTGWLLGVAITGNVINLSGSGTVAGITVTAATAFSVSSNVILGNGGTSFGIIVGAGAVNGLISPNTYSNLTTNISNSSGTTVVVTVP